MVVKREGSAATRAQDVLILVIVPLFLPAIALVATRPDPISGLPHGPTLMDVAFGIVAVSITVIARALVMTSSAWNTLALTAAGVGFAEAMVGVSTDTERRTRTLTSLILKSDKPPTGSTWQGMRSGAAAIFAPAPLWQWAFVIGIGTMLIIPLVKMILSPTGGRT